MFRTSIVKLLKQKPKVPKNPRANYMSENWSITAREYPNLTHKQIQASLNTQWNELDPYEKQELQTKYNNEKVSYRKSLKEFHHYCQAESGLPMPTKPKAPKDTGFTLFSKDNYNSVSADLPMNCNKQDLYKAMGELWRDSEESTKNWYNSQVKHHWDSYKLEKQEFENNMKIFENCGAPNKPKPAMTAFNLFIQENQKAGHEGFDSMVKLGKQWRSMSSHEKSHYENSIEVLDDKNRYNNELENYQNLKNIHDQKFTKPKKPLTNYQIFFMDKKPSYTERNPFASGQEITKMLAEAWNKLDENEKEVYDQEYKRNVEEYQGRMKVYEENKIQREKKVVW